MAWRVRIGYHITITTPSGERAVFHCPEDRSEGGGRLLNAAVLLQAGAGVDDSLGENRKRVMSAGGQNVARF